MKWPENAIVVVVVCDFTRHEERENKKVSKFVLFMQMQNAKDITWAHTAIEYHFGHLERLQFALRK